MQYDFVASAMWHTFDVATTLQWDIIILMSVSLCVCKSGRATPQHGLSEICLRNKFLRSIIRSKTSIYIYSHYSTIIDVVFNASVYGVRE